MKALPLSESMMLRSACRFSASFLVRRVLLHLHESRPISTHRAGPWLASQENDLFCLSPSDSSSAGESSSDAEDSLEGDQSEDSSPLAPGQVLRAYLRKRRERCISRVREQGLVPAVLVDPNGDRSSRGGSSDVFLSLNAKPLTALLKLIGKRDFISRVFDMEIYRLQNSTDIQESLQVLPRNVNYGPGKTNILNIQFIRALPGQVVKLGVPLEFLGEDRCPGIRKGGTLRKLAKYVVYNCKASELPAKIVVNTTVLEIGDQVQVQDLEVDFDRLHSDRTMPVCEIVKDASTLKAKVKRLKSELFFKKRALVAKEENVKTRSQSHLLTDDEAEEQEVPSRYKKKKDIRRGASGKDLRAAKKQKYSAKPGEVGKETLANGTQKQTASVGKCSLDSAKRGKPSKRRLFGTRIVLNKTQKSGRTEEQLNRLPGSMSKKHKVAIESSSEDMSSNRRNRTSERRPLGTSNR